MIKRDGREILSLRTANGFVDIEEINRTFGTDWPLTLQDVLDSGRFEALHRWYKELGPGDISGLSDLAVAETAALFAPLLRCPPKIWCIGLNYSDHAADLSERLPTGIPGSFMKPATTIIGHGDEIIIPLQSERTTAEAELGIIIGKRCTDVPPEEWLSMVAGFTTVIDMTAEDILRKNTRYLTVSKSFDTFFSFGPELVTPDEIGEISALRISTVLNENVHASNSVSNMTFSPSFLVSFLSGVMTLQPGDIISTGTPGAAPIRDGYTVECRIDGFITLINPVRDLKAGSKSSLTSSYPR